VDPAFADAESSIRNEACQGQRKNTMPRIGDICRIIPFVLCGLALTLAAGPARAQISIDESQRVGAVPGFSGTGLDGSYYYFPSNGIGSLSDAASLVSGAEPSARRTSVTPTAWGTRSQPFPAASRLSPTAMPPTSTT
jgi:hypothetical protein